MAGKRVRGVYGKPWSKMTKLEVTKETLEALGKCLVDTIVREAKKDFAMRGWSGKAPHSEAKGGPPRDGGPPIWDSFTYEVQGKSTLVIKSSFWGLSELVSGNIPSRRMVWLTQEYKDRHPSKFKLTPRERALGMKQTGRVLSGEKKGKRLPLVVPLKTEGAVVFRMAPLKMQDAWIHPGIAKFTFMQRAIRKGREKCAEILGEAVVEQLAQGDPSK